MIRGPQQFRQGLKRPSGPLLGPEHNPWYWHPNRAGVRSGPTWYQRKIDEIDPDVTLTWNPLKQEWLFWVRTPRVQTRYGNGWNLLFTAHPEELDERQFARLYSCSMKKWGNAKRYFDHIEATMIRDRERYERASRSDVLDKAMESFEHSQIKVSMFGPSSGSKFSTYHS